MAEPGTHLEMLLPSHAARRNAWEIHERCLFSTAGYNRHVLPAHGSCVSAGSVVTREKLEGGSGARWH